MDTADPNAGDCATPDQIRSAIEQMTKEDSYRLRMAATYSLFGTEYQNPQELINEAVVRTMNAANGEKGRAWKSNVSFMAFMVMTIRGLASDSRDSLVQTKTDYIEKMATEHIAAEDVLGAEGHFHCSPESVALEIDEMNERQAIIKADTDIIEAYFVNDTNISWIIMGIKDGCSSSEIKEMGEMTDTQYDTAKRRFRRGLEKLSMERSKS
ncbi:hypothetical protein ACIQW9_01105 [Herminiimonas sp. NPDC097707]|uniref:hypothetical protein n=1 Tax=Herminiimonas sp. NPDC097707 TaxID=3364007 RepID=UPI00383B85C7